MIYNISNTNNDGLLIQLTVVLVSSILATGVEMSKEVFPLASDECPVFSLPLQVEEVECEGVKG